MENVFHRSKFKAHSHDIFFSWTFDLLLINSRCLVFEVYFSPPTSKKYCMWIQTSWETNPEVKQTFSLVSDIDVENVKPVF